MNEKREPFLIGGNAHIRLQLYNVYKSDINIIKKARINVLEKLRNPQYANYNLEKTLALYEEEKRLLIEQGKHHRVDGLIEVFDKSHNI